MARLGRAVAASFVIAGGAVATALAAGGPPKVESLQVNPHKVCRTRSDTCKHPGATASWKLTEYSDVVASIRPLGNGRGATPIFRQKFSAGRHSKHFSVEGFPKNRYQLELTAVDPSNNRSHPAVQTFKIVK